MGALKELLVRRIRESGPMPLDEYMEACLLHPQHGYYCGPSPIGAHGSFTTAPEISQMFGELIGACLAQSWIDQGRPEKFTLAELGPGRGTLMSDLLRATRTVPGFNDCMHLHLVELSHSLRKAQEETLGDYSPVWCTHPRGLPDMPLYLIANEFFDSLPIRQFRRGLRDWREVLVGQESGDLKYVESEPVNCRFLASREVDVPPTGVVELRSGADQAVGAIADALRNRGGAAVIIDYGEQALHGDTFQAVRNHRPADPLQYPGTADLTAHVDFTALVRAAQGVSTTPVVTQREFLGRLGIVQRANSLARSASADQQRDLETSIRRLTGPTEMGSMFKVMALHPLNTQPPPGFH